MIPHFQSKGLFGNFGNFFRFRRAGGTISNATRIGRSSRRFLWNISTDFGRLFSLVIGYCFNRDIVRWFGNFLGRTSEGRITFSPTISTLTQLPSPFVISTTSFDSKTEDPSPATFTSDLFSLSALSLDAWSCSVVRMIFSLSNEAVAAIRSSEDALSFCDEQHNFKGASPVVPSVFESLALTAERMKKIHE